LNISKNVFHCAFHPTPGIVNDDFEVVYNIFRVLVLKHSQHVATVPITETSEVIAARSATHLEPSLCFTSCYILVETRMPPGTHVDILINRN
jgi:hypothetical protein